ncbi:hypothetical protein Xbed_00617 [Xenorhabdus beddingii]|uniref:NADP-dependent oxidoreductase domain-containing protein n=1 Tax=Xenorhabdus beddingii TaxID=40578 RepID=A0A1Y2SST6_9GAMM|nr:aldo/keto reductase [Xenorhabdus beddingii]OTA21388.1 hypothetical protein Xbed_00617 [Xenorhabdus beddingii]
MKFIPRLSLGCWKPARNTEIDFFYRLIDTGFSTLDLGEGYQFFGKNHHRLNFHRLYINRDKIRIVYKIGAKQTLSGNCLFEENEWDSNIQTFIRVTNADYIDCLMLWSIPEFAQLRLVCRWIIKKIINGEIKSFGMSNVSLLQVEIMCEIFQEETSSSLSEIPSIIQLRCTPLIPESLNALSLYKKMNLEIQAYGIFHSGLLFQNRSETHSRYKQEFEMISISDNYHHDKNGYNELLRKTIKEVISAGATTLVLSPRDDNQLSELRGILCEL